MAWSEPLFIFFVLLFLVHLEKFLANRDTTSFVILSLSAALACLTRYIGVTLILSGTLALLFLRQDGAKVKLSSLVLFVLLSAMPIGIWAVRNYAVSGTLFGPRASSVYTLPQNVEFAFSALISWYFPSRISGHRSVLMLIGASVGFLAGFTAKGNLTKLRNAIPRIGAIALFAAIYTAFMIFSSTTTAYDQIGDRLLSPIYIPVTLFLLTLAENLLEPFRERFSPQVVNVLLVVVTAMWLLYYPVRNTASDTANRMQQGGGGTAVKHGRRARWSNIFSNIR